MQIQAIRNVSFKANEPATEKPAENKDKKQAASLSDFYKKISSNVVYNTRRMSEGREEKDGKLKLAELGTAYASLGVLLLSMVKNIKSLKLKNKAQKLVKENEEKYGAEVRRKYGDEEVEASNRKLLNMTEEEWEAFHKLEEEIYNRLKAGVSAGMCPESEEAKQIVILHKKWLEKTWRRYTKEAHKAVAQGYTADCRFTQYYDREVAGCAKLLEQAVQIWADQLDEEKSAGKMSNMEAK